MSSQTTIPPLTDEEAVLLGSKLYPAVEAFVGSPSVTGKIVGMLIEVRFDPSHDDLRANVIKCLEVLKNHHPVGDPRFEEISVLSRHILARLAPDTVSGLPADSCRLYAFGEACTGACQMKHNARFVSTDPRKTKKVCKFFLSRGCGRPDCWASHESTIVFEDEVCVPPPVVAVAKIPMPPAVASVPPPVVAVEKIPMLPAVASVPPPVVAVAKDYIAFCFLHFSNQGCGCGMKDDQKHDAQEFARVGAKCPKLFVTATKFLGHRGLTLNVSGVQATTPPPAPACVPPPAVVKIAKPPARVPPPAVVKIVKPPVADDSKGYIAFCFLHFSDRGCGCEMKDDQKHDAQEFARVGAKCPKLFATASGFLAHKGLTLNVPGVQATAPPAPVRVPQQPVAAGGGGGIADRPVYCFAGLSAGQCFLRGCTGCHDRARFDLDCASSFGLRNAFKNYENGVKKKAAKAAVVKT